MSGSVPWQWRWFLNSRNTVACICLGHNEYDPTSPPNPRSYQSTFYELFLLLSNESFFLWLLPLISFVIHFLKHVICLVINSFDFYLLNIRFFESTNLCFTNFMLFFKHSTIPTFLPPSVFWWAFKTKLKLLSLSQGSLGSLNPFQTFPFASLYTVPRVHCFGWHQGTERNEPEPSCFSLHSQVSPWECRDTSSST